MRGLRPGAATAGFVMTALLLGGCAGLGPGPGASGPASPGYVSTWVEPEASELAPLRGTRVPAGSVENPSLAAKIDNHADARPQVGLEKTDIVFEELVEGGLTRYVAVWQSTIPDLIGPVRSIRPMDPDIVSAFGGIIAYSGGQQRFVALMQAAPVYNAIHGQSDTANTFFRTKDKAAPHNVLVKAAEVVGQHADLAPPRQQFAYSASPATSTAVAEGTPTQRLDLVFSTARYPSWAWSAESATWLRSQEGHPDLDGSGGQLAASNVIAITVGIDNSLGVPKTLLIGSGSAWVSSGGATIPATWNKASATDPIHLVDAQGATIRLAPGNTWIELIPTSGRVTVVPAGG